MQKHQCVTTLLIFKIIFYFEHEILQLLKILKFMHFKIQKKIVFMVLNSVDTYW